MILHQPQSLLETTVDSPKAKFNKPSASALRDRAGYCGGTTEAPAKWPAVHSFATDLPTILKR